MANAIMIEQNKRIGNWLLFNEMYKNYHNELGQYSKVIKFNPYPTEFLEDIKKESIWETYYILSDSGQTIGFVIIGIKSNKHYLSDFYIAETYIRKEYRRKGYATKAIKEIILKKRADCYCLYILKKNTKAKMFWKRFNEGVSFVDITSTSDNLPLHDNECDFFIYKKKSLVAQ